MHFQNCDTDLNKQITEIIATQDHHPSFTKGNDFHYISVLISVVAASQNHDPNIRTRHSNSWNKIASFLSMALVGDTTYNVITIA